MKFHVDPVRVCSIWNLNRYRLQQLKAKKKNPTPTLLSGVEKGQTEKMGEKQQSQKRNSKHFPGAGFTAEGFLKAL